MEKTVAEYGRLDVLVNNAGIYQFAPLAEITEEHYHRQFNLNVLGLILCTKEAAKYFGPEGGSVVNISSVARHGNPGQSNYSAAKAGLVADTKLWGSELSRYGIRVGAIAPGFVDTPILRGMRPEVLEGMLKTVPLKRAASPEEIFLAVKFVFECDYFTGRCIDVDGGISM